MPPILEGDRVRLQKLSAEDVNERYVSWLNDSEVCRYNSHGDTLYTLEMAREYVKRVSSSPAYEVFAIFAKDSGKHVGNISLQNIHAINRSAEYAILLGDKDYWGKGIAHEASELIVKYGFEELHLHRVWCGTSIENEPMKKLAARLHFKEEGLRRQAMCKNGRFVDVVEYGLLRDEYTSKV